MLQAAPAEPKAKAKGKAKAKAKAEARIDLGACVASCFAHSGFAGRALGRGCLRSHGLYQGIFLPCYQDESVSGMYSSEEEDV